MDAERRFEKGNVRHRTKKDHRRKRAFRPTALAVGLAERGNVHQRDDHVEERPAKGDRTEEVRAEADGDDEV